MGLYAGVFRVSVGFLLEGEGALEGLECRLRRTDLLLESGCEDCEVL